MNPHNPLQPNPDPDSPEQGGGRAAEPEPVQPAESQAAKESAEAEAGWKLGFAPPSAAAPSAAEPPQGADAQGDMPLPTWARSSDAPAPGVQQRATPPGPGAPAGPPYPQAPYPPQYPTAPPPPQSGGATPGNPYASPYPPTSQAPQSQQHWPQQPPPPAPPQGAAPGAGWVGYPAPPQPMAPPRPAYPPPQHYGYGPGPGAPHYGAGPGGPGGPPPGGPPVGGPGGWRASAPPPPPRGGQARAARLLIGLAALVIFGLVGYGLLSVISGSGSTGGGSRFSLGPKIGLLEVEGAIGDGIQYEARSRELISTVRKWERDESIKGIVVRINSPGGTVAATQEVYKALKEYRTRTGRPVIASMGDIAASGGFYTAMACDEVYANAGTLTGSIGVILNFTNLQGLTEKVGLSFNAVKSGRYKDIGSPYRDMTDDERKLLQGMIDDVYSQFVTAVEDARAESLRDQIAAQTQRDAQLVSDDEVTSRVRTYADGRIFSGQQAIEIGFIDHIGSLGDAVRRVQTLTGMKGEPTLVSSRVPRGLFEALGGETKSVIRQMTPGHVAIEYRFAP